MLPFIYIFHYKVPTNSLMELFLSLCALFTLILFCRKEASFLKHLLFILLMAPIVFISARLFYVLFEKPDLLNTPRLIFSQFDGMTFNGSLIAGWVLGPLIGFLIYKDKLPRILDISAIFTSFGYGFLRIGCFLNGCCWGEIYGGTLSVRYFHPNSFMPYKGIPVHPVQLYDAALGFSLFFALIYLKRVSVAQGRLPFVFLITYSLGRFVTENFRGDSFRGVDIIWGLSISQVFSIIVISICLYFLLRCRPTPNSLKPSSAYEVKL